MATQHLLQLQSCKQEQHTPQILQSQTQQSIVYPVMAWAGAAGPPSSPGGPALYEVHSNSGSEGSQLSHGDGVASQGPTATAQTAADGDASWEVRAFAEDSASCSGQWPPRSYACSFCRREFRTAQALGGHMNVHRRERAQANNMAILKSTAQKAAAAATAAVATPQPRTAVAGPHGQAQWCLYSPVGVGVNPSASAAAATPERRAFFYSSLAPGGAILTMTSSSGGSSQFTARSSPGLSPPSHSQYNNDNNKKTGTEGNTNNAGGTFTNGGVQISSSQFSTSPMASPASQGSRSSGSSVITKSGSAGSQDGRAGVGPPYRSSTSVSGDSVSLARNLQLGAFQPYHQSRPFAHEAAPLITQELIQLRPQHHNSTVFSKSMGIRGPTDDVGIVDLELRLGPA